MQSESVHDRVIVLEDLPNSHVGCWDLFIYTYIYIHIYIHLYTQSLFVAGVFSVTLLGAWTLSLGVQFAVDLGSQSILDANDIDVEYGRSEKRLEHFGKSRLLTVDDR